MYNSYIGIGIGIVTLLENRQSIYITKIFCHRHTSDTNTF